MAEMRRRLARPSWPEAEHHQPQPPRRGRVGRLSDLGGVARTRPRRAGDLLAARHRAGAEAPEPRRPQDLAEHRQPGDPRRAGSATGGRPRRPDEDRRRRAAAHGRRRRRDLDLPRGRGAVPRQDTRPGEPAARSRGDRQAHGRVVQGRSRAHRQHRAARSRPRPEHAAALQPPVLGQPHLRHRARPRAGRGVQRRSQGPRRPPSSHRDTRSA